MGVESRTCIACEYLQKGLRGFDHRSQQELEAVDYTPLLAKLFLRCLCWGREEKMAGGGINILYVRMRTGNINKVTLRAMSRWRDRGILVGCICGVDIIREIMVGWEFYHEDKRKLLGCGGRKNECIEFFCVFYKAGKYVDMSDSANNNSTAIRAISSRYPSILLTTLLKGSFHRVVLSAPTLVSQSQTAPALNPLRTTSGPSQPTVTASPRPQTSSEGRLAGSLYCPAA